MHSYHGLLEGATGGDNFGTSLDGYDTSINYDEDDITQSDNNEDE